jgi:hypothetical protein
VSTSIEIDMEAIVSLCPKSRYRMEILPCRGEGRGEERGGRTSRIILANGATHADTNAYCSCARTTNKYLCLRLQSVIVSANSH